MHRGFCQVIISAEDEINANEIASHLLKKKLIIGCLMVSGPAKFWWKGKMIDMKYYNIQALSVLKNKLRIISEAEKVSREEVPIIMFYEIDVNKKTSDWIKEYL